MPDADGYPTNAELVKVENFIGSPKKFVEYLQSIWWYDPPTVKYGRNSLNRGVKRVQMHTWGWSGNEEIMGLVDKSWFSFLFHTKWERGGHFTYEVGLDLWEHNLDNIGSIDRKLKRS